MIALRLSVPVACWRKGPTREYLETELVPPPATCYGALLALVGEVDPERHRGCRVTPGLLRRAEHSVVLRTLWRIKARGLPQGQKANARPDFQQLAIGAELMVWCDSSEELDPGPSLETRVTLAMERPDTVDRFGGWSLGESTHLINDAALVADARPPGRCEAFLTDPAGDLTLPVWVDHVGSEGTRYAVGRLEPVEGPPPPERLPRVVPPEIVPRSGAGPKRRGRGRSDG